MKKQNSVLRQEQSALYEAAIAFKKLRSWEWMYDGELFGVQNPVNGEIGYCCIMGALGEVFALNVYPGTEGLRSYLYIHEQSRLAEEGVLVDGPALLNSQKCLMASFEDRKDLQNTDLNDIKKLGLKFRGRKEWPLFRSYRPGFVPWYLLANEVQLLTVALQQAVIVSLKVQGDPNFLFPAERKEGQYLVRVLKGGKWCDGWQQPADFEKPKKVPLVNEVLLAQLKRSKFVRQGVWETDCIILPMVIEEGERPFYPYGFPVLRDDGVALCIELVNPGELESTVPNKFLELLQKIKFLPERLLVGSQRAKDLLDPIAGKLGIKIEKADTLPNLEHFLREMESSFGGKM